MTHANDVFPYWCQAGVRGGLTRSSTLCIIATKPARKSKAIEIDAKVTETLLFQDWRSNPRNAFDNAVPHLLGRATFQAMS